MTEFDDQHHPVPSVDFDFDQVGRALGELEDERETLERVLSAADIMGRFYEIIMDGLGDARNANRNHTIRARVEVLMYFLRKHPHQNLSLKQLAEKMHVREKLVYSAAKLIRSKFSMPERVLYRSGDR